MRTWLSIVMLLGVGCGSAVHVECADAGAPVDPDAGETTFELYGEVDSVTACRMLGFADEQREENCLETCPWQGFSGPGVPVQRCELSALIECIDAVAARNSCENVPQLMADHCQNICVE